MKIIILKDKKGFSKQIEVAFFPPIYKLALPIQKPVFSSKLDKQVWEEITFYPTSAQIFNQYDVDVRIYEEL